MSFTYGLLFLLAIAISPGAAFGANQEVSPTLGCESTEKKVADFLKYIEGEDYFLMCKIWPSDPTKTIVAAARYQPGSSLTFPPTAETGLYDLDVVIASTESGVILHHLSKKGAISSDAFRLQGVGIDTGRYRFAIGVRGFGVRAYHSVRPDASVTSTFLFALEGNQLKEVLSDLKISESYYERDACSYTVRTRTIGIAPTSTNRYSDLVVKEKEEVGVPVQTKKGCSVGVTRMFRRYILQFDGTQYVVPGALSN
jgi:hypothetical protein